MKTCSKCGESRALSEFCKDKMGRGGLCSACKACKKAWWLAHTEKHAAYSKVWREGHPKECKATHKAYREVHLEECKAYSKAWNKAHPEECKASYRAWYKAHPELRMVANHARRARVLATGGRFSAQEWRDLKAQYDHTCICCGRKEPEVMLTPDHVIPLVRGGSNSISNIQPLCLVCNQRKFTEATDYRPGATIMIPVVRQLALFEV